VRRQDQEGLEMSIVSKTKQRLVSLAAYLIIATAIVGYFVGIQSPMNHLDKKQASEAASEMELMTLWLMLLVTPKWHR
jgi:hypothetical protein